MSLSLRGLKKPKMDVGGCVGPQCQGCSSGSCMSKGGTVAAEDDKARIKGVHPGHKSSIGGGRGASGESRAGDQARWAGAVKQSGGDESSHRQAAVGEHKRVLGEMKSLPKPKLYAGGGEVEEGEAPALDLDADAEAEDSSMLDACADELMDALERKDKGQILEAIKAIVLSVR